MGAQIEVDGGYVVAKAPGGLKGANIQFPFPTVGGTENIMMAASLAKGQTTIQNAAQEPEIVDLANYLNKMGADVQGAGESTIQIQGQENLQPAEHDVIPDRIETGTLMVAAAITNGKVKINNCDPTHLTSFNKALQQMGIELDFGDDFIQVQGNGGYASIQITTEPFPGFPTDLQAQLMALMTQVPGKSRIIEKVFENRFMHVSELMRLGAKIEVDGHEAIIHGAEGHLVGAPVMATDLRASASLILAGLVASGETVVNRIYHLDRGYENLEGKLKSLGADIERIKE